MKFSTIKKILLCAFAVVLFCTVFIDSATKVSASGSTDVIASGECGASGKNLTWKLDSDGTLRIGGSGCMKEYSPSGNAPWKNHSLNIKSIEVSNTVTGISEGAFSGCGNLESIHLPFVGSDRTASIHNSFGYIFGSKEYEGGVNISQLYSPPDDGTPHVEAGDIFNPNSGVNNYFTYYIPSSLKKVTVDAGGIHKYSFQNADSITSVILCDGVTSIGSNAFSGCTGLSRKNSTISRLSCTWKLVLYSGFRVVLNMWCHRLCKQK